MKTVWIGTVLVILLALAGGVATAAESSDPPDRSRIVFFVH
jgi:hypothetical protein